MFGETVTKLTRVFFSDRANSHRAAGDHVRGAATGPVGHRSVQDTDQGNRRDGDRCVDTRVPTLVLPTSCHLPQLNTRPFVISL